MTELRCAEGHGTRARRQGESLLPCGCVVDLTSEDSRAAMAAAGVDPDEFVVEDGATVHREEARL